MQLCLVTGLFAFFSESINAQSTTYIGQDLNTITTAVPFLQIAPDARSGGMGEAGVSSTPDANSMHWNPAKYSYIENEMGFSLSYSPWLRALVSDINLAYLTGYKKLGNNQVVSGSLLYFSLGDITFTDIQGATIGNYRPNEFAISGSYSRMLTKNLSGAVTARIIHSNLTQGQSVGGASTKPGNSIAADIAIYSRHDIEFQNMEGFFAWGLNISNIGSKISYSDDNTQRDFIPTNLRFGPSLTLDIDEYNRLSFMVDINKLLIPTPPVYATDSSTGQPIYDDNGNQLIFKGKDPNVSVPVGMFQSFFDAPGGFNEEIRELSFAVGVEYWYDKQFAIRGGYFHEDRTKGNRKFFTLGAGLRYNVFGLDFAYLIPTGGQAKNPLENTLRFTLHFDFEAFQKQNNQK
ncbi:MAG: type IX secretion system outer membrane channel protein PorV [Lentimicrobium sp.]|uniref:type IX secretion system outer membrane channel protein PorV n=1 Tax=Lentimicrobium sp. TaxID=2034841 RepID=UPI002B216A53|nr:type IX secretion system outer membrane channel protein PorV [Lentimicrobium sp.]MEA5112098.1 type IX secretion system outer membrane channel protein PorV [Lentimicrobium sp.]